jgi:hypothetical protein
VTELREAPESEGEAPIRLADWEVRAPPSLAPAASGAAGGAELLRISRGSPLGAPLGRFALRSVIAIAAFFLVNVAIVHRLTELPVGTQLVIASPAPAAEPVHAVAPQQPASPPKASGAPAPPPPRARTGATRTASAKPRPAPGREGTSAAAKIEVSLRLDPRLTRGNGMGDRWLPSSAFTAHRGGPIAFHARAAVFDGRDVKTDATPTWTAAEPDLVTVSPGRGDRVELRIGRPGRTTIEVRAGPARRTLDVRAFRDAGALRAEVTQRGDAE